MKAIVFREYGLPYALQMEDVARPQPRNNEVRIKVCAVSVNDWDWQLLQGIPFVNRLAAGIFKPTRIQILGCDVAGVVETAGRKVTRFRPGDAVFGDLSGCGWGGFAEYVCAREGALVAKPADMTFEQAAAIPQAGLLALQGLFGNRLQQRLIQPGQRILINGASGGAGSFAVQIAKSFGAEVTGVCSTRKMDFVRSIGADHVMDYVREDFTVNEKSYDLVLDMQARHPVFDCWRSLRSGGRYVAVGGPTGRIMQVMYMGLLISLFTDKNAGLLLLKSNKGLDLMIEFFQSGRYAPCIDKTFALGETAEAFRYFGEGYKKGKVVVTVGNNT